MVGGREQRYPVSERREVRRKGVEATRDRRQRTEGSRVRRKGGREVRRGHNGMLEGGRRTTVRNQFLLHLNTPSQKTRVVVTWTNKGVAEAVHLRPRCLVHVYYLPDEMDATCVLSASFPTCFFEVVVIYTY